MVDITQPSFMGYTVTPWLIIMCLCIIGAIVFAILIVSGISKRGIKERKMIENAVKNTSATYTKSTIIPVSGPAVTVNDSTEVIEDNQTEVMINESTEMMEEYQETEVLDKDTEVLGA